MRLLRMTLIIGMGGLSLATALLVGSSSQSLSKPFTEIDQHHSGTYEGRSDLHHHSSPHFGDESAKRHSGKGSAYQYESGSAISSKINNPPISRTQALVIAKSYDNAPALSVTSVKLTGFTFPGSIPGSGTTLPCRTIERMPAWVVTPTPVNVSQAPTGVPVYVTHDNLVIECAGGVFCSGIFYEITHVFKVQKRYARE